MSDDWLLQNAESFTPPEDKALVVTVENTAVLVITEHGTVHFSDQLVPEEAAKQAWKVLLDYVAQYNDNIKEYLQWKNSEHSRH